MALESPDDDGIKREALRLPMLAEAMALLQAQRTELVVIGGAQRGLPVSH